MRQRALNYILWCRTNYHSCLATGSNILMAEHCIKNMHFHIADIVPPKRRKCYFRALIFKNFLGEDTPRPPYKPVMSNPGSAPDPGAIEGNLPLNIVLIKLITLVLLED